jgi:hypothetical protein
MCFVSWLTGFTSDMDTSITKRKKPFERPYRSPD